MKMVKKLRAGVKDFLATVNSEPSLKMSGTIGSGGTMLHSSFPYDQVAWVFTCVSLKEQSIQQLGYDLVSDIAGQEGDKIDKGPLLDLMKNPNPIFDWWEMLGAMSVWMDLEGEAFWLKEEVNGRLVYLWPLNPQYMAYQRDYATGDIAYWRYTDPQIPYWQGEKNRTVYEFKPDELIHWKSYNPRDPYRGISPLLAGRQSIDTEYSAHRFDEKVLANAGAIGGAYSTVAPLGKQQHAQLQEIIRQRYTGPDNAGKSILLHSGVTYDPTSWSPKELLLSDLKHMSRTEICGLFKVPPQKVGIPESQTYSNYEEADKHYWTVAILPRARALVRKLSQQLCVPYQPGTRYALDVTGISSLQDPLADKLDQGAKLLAMGYSLNQVNTRLSLGMNQVDWGDEVFITTGLQSYEHTINPPAPPPMLPPGGDEDGGEDEEDEVKQILPTAGAIDAGLRREFLLSERLLTPQKHLEAQMLIHTSRYYREFRAAALRRVDVWFGDETALKALEDRLEECSSLMDSSQKAINLTAFVFDAVGREVNRLWDRVSPYVDLAWNAGVRQAQRVLEISGNLGEKLGAAKERFLGEREEKLTVTEMDGELRAALAATLAEGESQAETAVELSTRVKKVFDTVPNPERISRTESTAPLNEGRYQASQEAGADYKFWLTVMDELVRHQATDNRPFGWIQEQKEQGMPGFYGMTPNHRILHGEIVTFNEAFANGYQYPQSGGAIHGNDAGESINCRCQAVYGSGASLEETLGKWEDGL